MNNTYSTKQTLSTGGKDYHYHSLPELAKKYPQIARLPFSLKILLENLLRKEDGISVATSDISYLAEIDLTAKQEKEIAFSPARVVMQDFTGVPAVVDLASMRDAVSRLGGDPNAINPITPVELVIDHSVMVDHWGSNQAADLNKKLEYKRNQERYEFLKWGSQAFSNFKVVPPSTGIVHQVNLEYLARVVCQQESSGETYLFPDTVVGTDSHTTMINGLGVLGWGVGGIEAEAVMLGQPISMLIPSVIGFKLEGSLQEGVTATDLVLTIVEILRKKGVVGKFVEFYGSGLDSLSLADRATIANMAPEYGATCGIFPVDKETLQYLRLTNRNNDHISVIESYLKAQGMFYNSDQEDPIFSDTLSLALGDVEPSIAGPKRPQDRITLSQSKAVITKCIGREKKSISTTLESGDQVSLSDGDIVIAAITSCTNTSNPSVIIGAGLLAKKACSLGLQVPRYVKTSLAPGSLVVSEYLERAGLQSSLDEIGFSVVGYGCTTCIGNSGPLDSNLSKAIHDEGIAAAAVLSGNRNFEGRIHADVTLNFLASPPLVVAYALAGRSDIDFANEPIAIVNNKEIYLKDIWPTSIEIEKMVTQAITKELYQSSYESVFAGDSEWNSVSVTEGSRFAWNADSTYVQNPPYFETMQKELPPLPDLANMVALVKVGDSITTDHISPAGAIKPDSPAGEYLSEKNTSPGDFNSYGSRRGNHQVMMRGTFANARLKNELAPGTTGGFTTHFPSNAVTTIFDAAMRYQASSIPTMVLAGKEYGSGSSRDWAGKGPSLLGIRMVIAESYERIHRSNLVGMGVLPLQFMPGESSESLGLTGKELFSVSPFDSGANQATVTVTSGDEKKIIQAIVRIDTPKEWEYYQHRGILNFMVRKLSA